MDSTNKSDKTRPKPWFGSFALLLALSALGLSIFPSWIESVEEIDEPTLSERFSESASSAKESLMRKFKGEEGEGAIEEAGREISWAQISKIGGVGLGFAAVVFGIIAYVRREDLRLGATASVVGVTAIAWHNLFAAVALGVMLITIGFVVRGLAHHDTA